MMKRIASFLVAAFVVGGLSYGAAQLRAGEPLVCEGYHGTCTDEQACRDLCLQLFPLNGGEGICFWNGCCMCAER